MNTNHVVWLAACHGSSGERLPEDSLPGATLDPLDEVSVAWIDVPGVRRIVNVGNVAGEEGDDVALCVETGTEHCEWRVYASGTQGHADDAAATISDPDGFGPWIAGGADLSGDGEPDLVLSKARACIDQPAGPVLVFFGPLKGDLSSSDANVTIVPDAADQNFGTLASWLGDLDRDGGADLLVGSGCDPVRFYGWRGPLTDETAVANADLRVDPYEPDWTPFWTMPGVLENVDGSARTAIVLDVGWTFLGSFDGWSKALPLFQISWKSSYAQGNDYFLSLAEPSDVDGDGAKDVIIHTDATTHPHTAVWTTTIWGAGIGTHRYCIRDASHWSSTFLLFPADVNGDGQTDLVESALDTYLGPIGGFGTCEAPLPPSVPTPLPDRGWTLTGREIAAVDWDGDGKDEIVASFGDEGVGVLRIGQD